VPHYLVGLCTLFSIISWIILLVASRHLILHIDKEVCTLLRRYCTLVSHIIAHHLAWLGSLARLCWTNWIASCTRSIWLAHYAKLCLVCLDLVWFVSLACFILSTPLHVSVTPFCILIGLLRLVEPIMLSWIGWEAIRNLGELFNCRGIYTSC
jgi:hypothetical protein